MIRFRHVADRVDVVDVGPRPCIDEDRSTRRGRDARVLEPKSRGVRVAPGRVQDEVRVHRLRLWGTRSDAFGAGKHRPNAAPAFAAPRGSLDCGNAGIEAEIDPSVSHLVGKRAANVVVEAAKKERTPVELRHLDPEAAKHPRELDRDVTAPDDDDPLRQSLQVKDVVGSDGMLDAGNVRKHRPAAGRDENVAGGDRASGHGNGVGADDRCPRIVEPCARSFDEVPVDPVQALDLAILVRDEGGPVERGCSGGSGRPGGLRASGLPPPPEPGRVLEVLREVGGIHEELLRDTSHVDAGAAEKTLFRHRDARAVPGRDPRRPGPSGPRTDDEEVVVEDVH